MKTQTLAKYIERKRKSAARRDEKRPATIADINAIMQKEDLRNHMKNPHVIKKTKSGPTYREIVRENNRAKNK